MNIYSFPAYQETVLTGKKIVSSLLLGRSSIPFPVNDDAQNHAAYKFAAGDIYQNRRHACFHCPQAIHGVCPDGQNHVPDTVFD
jgi:hypothetical protein